MLCFVRGILSGNFAKDDMTCFTQYFMLALPKKYSFLSGILSAFLLGLPKNSSFIRGILSTCTHFFPKDIQLCIGILSSHLAKIRLLHMWNSFFSPYQRIHVYYVEFILLALPKFPCSLSWWNSFYSACQE